MFLNSFNPLITFCKKFKKKSRFLTELVPSRHETIQGGASQQHQTLEFRIQETFGRSRCQELGGSGFNYHRYISG